MKRGYHYYDVNFRSTHKNEAIKLLPVILENFEYADIIRGSVEDFENMFGLTDADKVYKSKIEFYCPHFICTHGGKGIRLYTKNIKSIMKRILCRLSVQWEPEIILTPE